MPKKLYILKCRKCRNFLCETDGECLFIENLEVLPKTRKVNQESQWIVKGLICDRCGETNKIHLKKPEPSKTEPARKFSIFRSRI